MSRAAIVMATLIVGFLVFTTIAVTLAVAHEATPTAAQPLGWSYPYSCCSGMDCREVDTATSPVAVTETPEGYAFSTSDEVIPYNDPRIKESPDGLFHWCTVAGEDSSRTICLFVPPRGF